jgi:ParB-like chromosome segregation protein Spo0J
MTRKQAEGLRLSIERFGFAVPFLVSSDGDIYDGHQRQALMGAIREYGPNATVDVRVSSRPLDDDERRELVVRLKQNQAGWDFDMLPNLYEREELLEWGFDDAELGMAFVPDFEPVDESTQPRLDQKAPVTCPHCGMEFVPE